MDGREYFAKRIGYAKSLSLSESRRVQVPMTIEVTADTASAARDKASTLANRVLGNLSAVRTLDNITSSFFG